MKAGRTGLSLLALCVLSALVACPKSVPRGVRVAVHSDPLSLDPHEFNEVLTFGLLSNVYEALTNFNKDVGLVPGLAESWENPDERTWRFHLRAGSRFHDGRPLEAEDVAFSVERARKTPKSQLSSYLVQVESVKAIDTHVVEIRTRRPFAVLLNKLASVYIVPRGSPFPITQPIGSGPFRLLSFEKGKRFLLERVEKDGGGTSIPTLEFLPFGDAGKRLSLLLAGDVDVALDPDPARTNELKASPCCRLALRPSATVEYLHLEVGDPRFRDLRVRQALDLGLDRRLVIEKNLEGYGQPASQLVPPGVFGYDPGLAVTERDVARARRLLAEAGFPDGFEVTLVHRQGRRGEEIARQLREIGIRVTDSAEPYPQVSQKLRQGSVPFYFGGVAAITGDASDVLDSFVHSKNGGYGQTNFTGYANPELDRLIEESGEKLDQSARRSLLQHCLRKAMDDRWMLPLDIPYDTYGVKKDLVWEPRLDRRLMGREMRWR